MDLPEDILYNILTRTPTKSLARFKCVSKHWNLMISDPEFMNSRSHRMILLPLLPFQAIDNNTKLPEEDDDYYSSVKLLDPPFTYKAHYSIVGTFNGILFLVLKDHIKEHMILYNPLTGSFKKILDPPLRSLRKSIFPCYGFGYGTTQDDLKIVRLDTRFCDVFSLKNGSWSTPAKLIGKYFAYFHGDEGTFVNGCLYWLAFNRRLNRFMIVALDLKKMAFSEIELPSEGDFITLGTLKGSLCVVCYKESSDNDELWVMKEDGFVLEKILGFRLHEKGCLGFKMSILDEGKIFKFDITRNRFVIFDMLKDEYKEVRTITSQGFTSKAIEYVESWVSPSDICF